MSCLLKQKLLILSLNLRPSHDSYHKKEKYINKQHNFSQEKNSTTGNKYKIVTHPCEFFLSSDTKTNKSLPQQPLQQSIKKIPILSLRPCIQQLLDIESILSFNHNLSMSINLWDKIRISYKRQAHPYGIVNESIHKVTAISERLINLHSIYIHIHRQ